MDRYYHQGFSKQLQKIIEDCIKAKKTGYFVQMAVNNLPTVISWYGVEVADKILDDIEGKIHQLTDTEHLVARTYIDQIGIVVHPCSKEEGHQFIDKLQDFVRNYKCPLISDPIALRISAGGASFPDNSQNAEDVVLKAYVALSTARDPVTQTSFADYIEAQESQLSNKSEISLMHYMRQVLKDDQLRIAYQPIIESKTGKVAAYECLLRIQEQNGKVTSAGTMVPIAEKMGFVDVIDQLVLEKIIAQIKEAKALGKDVTFTLNISNQTTDNPKWLAACNHLLEDHEIASKIIFEITETAAQRDLRQTAYFVASLQALGSRVALDDFGAGYTSFRQLKNLSVDMVKIDGLFIREMSENSENLLFIKTLLDFNNSYGLKTIAECVETGDVAKRLMDINIDYLQGYYFGKPDFARPWLEGTSP